MFSQDGKMCLHKPQWRLSYEHRFQSSITATLVRNMIHGVSCGWKKTVRLYGKGYRAFVDEDNPRRLTIRCGHVKPIIVEAEVGTSFEVLKPDDMGYPIVVRGMSLDHVCDCLLSNKNELRGSLVRSETLLPR